MSETQHTCNPKAPGKPLPFGRRDPLGNCLRCLELNAGDSPRAGWNTTAAQDEARSAEIRAHFDSQTHRSGGCGVVCTFGDW